MKFIQRTVELKWPILLVELFFLIGGILLLISGIKLQKKKQNNSSNLCDYWKPAYVNFFIHFTYNSHIWI